MIEKVKLNNISTKTIKIDKRNRIYICKKFFSNVFTKKPKSVLLSLFEDGFFISDNFFEGAIEFKSIKLDINNLMYIPKLWLKALNLSCETEINVYKLPNGLFISSK